MSKKFRLAAPLAIIAGAMLVTPASAANFSDGGQIRAEIQQLDRQIDGMRGISPREEQRLERQVDRLEALYRDYARGGFSRNELQRLDREVSAVKMQIHQAARDGKPSPHRDDPRHHDNRPGAPGHRR